jgi:hypothetical protein
MRCDCMTQVPTDLAQPSSLVATSGLLIFDLHIAPGREECISAVPNPTSLVLLAPGLGGIGPSRIISLRPREVLSCCWRYQSLLVSPAFSGLLLPAIAGEISHLARSAWGIV